jgi:hypothetical protein
MGRNFNDSTVLGILYRLMYHILVVSIVDRLIKIDVVSNACLQTPICIYHCVSARTRAEGYLCISLSIYLQAATRNV